MSRSGICHRGWAYIPLSECRVIGGQDHVGADGEFVTATFTVTRSCRLKIGPGASKPNNGAFRKEFRVTTRGSGWRNVSQADRSGKGLNRADIVLMLFSLDSDDTATSRAGPSSKLAMGGDVKKFEYFQPVVDFSMGLAADVMGFP